MDLQNRFMDNSGNSKERWRRIQSESALGKNTRCQIGEQRASVCVGAVAICRGFVLLAKLIHSIWHREYCFWLGLEVFTYSVLYLECIKDFALTFYHKA